MCKRGNMLTDLGGAFWHRCPVACALGVWTLAYDHFSFFVFVAFLLFFFVYLPQRNGLWFHLLLIYGDAHAQWHSPAQSQTRALPQTHDPFIWEDGSLSNWYTPLDHCAHLTVLHHKSQVHPLFFLLGSFSHLDSRMIKIKRWFHFVNQRF